MDPETAKKVNELAQNLKALHMAATMEEAIEKAREIIIGNVDDSAKSIKELMSEVEQEKSEFKKESEAIDCIKKDLKEIKNIEAEDEYLRDKKLEQMQKMEQDLEDVQEDAALVKENIKAAEMVQEEE